MKIICWNVNGLRAIEKKGFLEFMEREDPDILCLQETKLQAHQVTQELLNPLGYYSVWDHAGRAGYSGVVTYSKQKALNVSTGLNNPEFDGEGRLVQTEFPDFVLINVYMPNGGQGDHRIEFKLNYYDLFLDHIEGLRKAGKNLILCGDFNTAHKEIDLARPKENEFVTGFLAVERAWLDKLVAHGYVDTFRALHPEQQNAYTWWSYRSGARPRNVGWRIDYFYVNEEFFPHIEDSYMRNDIEGSDHCPIVLLLKSK